MDMQTCIVCEEDFDFDLEGFSSDSTGQIVCGNDCAKKLAHSRGNKVAIHNSEGTITETDAWPEQLPGETICAGRRASLKTTDGGLLVYSKIHKQVLFFTLTSQDLYSLAQSLELRENDRMG